MRYTTLLVVGLLVLTNVLAVETPRGIDGHVYALDGVTPVPDLVDIELQNLDGEGIINIHPGRGSPGRYSVVLPWPKGTNVQITATNPVHTTTRNVTLEGIIHGADLFLNMTLPQLPPVFISSPVVLGEQYEVYTYIVNVYDWNYDSITLTLNEYPAGAELTGTSLVWTPSQPGSYGFSISAYDGTNYTLQEYEMSVYNVNDPPVFSDVTHHVQETSGSFKLNATDPEEDTLTYSMPETPGISVSKTGTLSYEFEKPVKLVSGIVTVSDGYLNATGTVIVTTKKKVKPPKTGKGGGGGGYFPEYEPPKPTHPKPTPPKVGKLEKVPKGIPPLEKVTYAYFKLPAGTNEYDFSVARSWLKSHGVDLNDVKLYSYKGGWREHRKKGSLLTGNAIYSADVVGVTIFAIAIDKLPEDLDLVQLSITEPTVLVGSVVDTRGNPLPEGTVVTIADLETGETFSITTGNGPGENSFQAVLDDVKGHSLRVSVNGVLFIGEVTVTASSLNDITIVVHRKNLLTGRAVGVHGGGSLFYALLVTLCLAGLYLRGRIVNIRKKL